MWPWYNILYLLLHKMELHSWFYFRPFTRFIESWQKLVLVVITGPSIKDQYSMRTNYVVLDSMPKLRVVCRVLCYITLALIISMLIHTDTCTQVLLKMLYGPYSNGKYVFACPTVLRKFVARMTVGRS